MAKKKQTNADVHPLAPLPAAKRTDEQRIAALEDLRASVEVDNTAGRDEDADSYMVLGNVDAATLRILGFDLDDEPATPPTPVVAKAAAAEPDGIILTPDFANMFINFMRDARNIGLSPRMFADLGAHAAESTVIEGRAIQAAALRATQHWFAALTIAAQSATSVKQIEAMRDLMADILAHIDTMAMRLENAADDASEFCECGRKWDECATRDDADGAHDDRGVVS